MASRLKRSLSPSAAETAVSIGDKRRREEISMTLTSSDVVKSRLGSGPACLRIEDSPPKLGGQTRYGGVSLATTEASCQISCSGASPSSSSSSSLIPAAPAQRCPSNQNGGCGCLLRQQTIISSRPPSRLLSTNNNKNAFLRLCSPVLAAAAAVTPPEPQSNSRFLLGEDSRGLTPDMRVCPPAA